METTHDNSSVLEAVVAYWRRGFAVIDWPQGVKGTDEKWAEKRYDSDEKLRDAFGGEPKNVGIKLGEPSGWLVDVDLDVPEAVAVADSLLPETTMVSGRPGSRRSHRWYLAPGAETDKWRIPKGWDQGGKPIIELRSTGVQTVVPPSVHPSGERYEWYGGLEPAGVDAEGLHKACCALATAVLIARCLPDEGRHDFALPLAGFLLRPGRLDEETALAIMKAAWDAAGYPPGKDRAEAHRDLDNIVRNTARALDAGEEVSGGPTLDEEYAPGLPKAIAKAWGWKLGKEDKVPQAQVLVDLAGEAELFHDADGEPYATIPVGEHRETHRIRSKGFKRWLQKLFYEAEGKPVGSQALQDALGALEGMAIFDGAEREAHVRLAEHGEAIYLDLCNKDWEVVEITQEGWRVIPGEAAPVRFRRSRGMLPLPPPSKDGDLAGLRRLLNLPEEDQGAWVLIAAWLAAALRPRGPYPVLVLQGEQGSAKSTAQRMLRALVDPSTVPLRTAPREERDLMIAATNGWCVAYDNLSGLPIWLSDALCRLATGGGFGTRQLYTDQEEVVFAAMRPAMLNGIADVATRPDLLDRSLVVELPLIPEERRRTEREIWAEFATEHPRVLGALLDVVSGAMRGLPEVRLERLPRMAEFAEWATAAEEGLGLSDGAFMDAYAEARSDAVGQALEGDAVAEAVLAFMTDKREWTGTSSELHRWLALKVDANTQRTRGWPKTSSYLSAKLKRLAPALRAVGLEWEEWQEGDKNKTRKKRLRWREGEGPSEEEIEERKRSGGGLFGTPTLVEEQEGDE